LINKAIIKNGEEITRKAAIKYKWLGIVKGQPVKPWLLGSK